MARRYDQVIMRNRTGQTIADYAGLLAEALPLLDLPTDPVTLGGWNGGDARTAPP